MDHIIEKVRKDLASANEELVALTGRILELQRLAKKYTAFLELYEQETDPAVESINAAAAPLPRFIPGMPSDKTPIEESQTAKARITNLVATILADGRQMSTKDLLEEIQSRGVEPGSKDKHLALSALLSKDGRFEPDRKLGWSLKK